MTSGVTVDPVARNRATAALLRRLGYRYAGAARCVVGALTAFLAPFAGPPVGTAVCLAVACVFAGWNLFYLRRMRGSPHVAVRLADVAVVVALAVAQPLLVDPGLIADQLSWVSPICSLTCITVQWHLAPRPAAVATLVIVTAYVTGAALSPGVSLVDALLGGSGVFMLLAAALSRLLWQLVVRGSRAADEVMAARFAQMRVEATESARRAEQRRHWAAVHDTAASTLLMVGLGEVSGREPWLPAQLDRDISALDRDPGPPVAGELREALAVTVSLSPLRIRIEVDRTTPSAQRVRLPDAVVSAVDGAVREALENVRRHASRDGATLHVRHDTGSLHVEVADDGAGFDPESVAADRTGIALSVRERMAAVGGRGVVGSAPGAGTRVALDWPW